MIAPRSHISHFRLAGWTLNPAAFGSTAIGLVYMTWFGAVWNAALAGCGCRLGAEFASTVGYFYLCFILPPSAVEPRRRVRDKTSCVAQPLLGCHLRSY